MTVKKLKISCNIVKRRFTYNLVFSFFLGVEENNQRDSRKN